MFEILKKLSKRELSEFRRYLNYAYSKEGETVNQLFNILASHHPAFNKEKISYSILSETKINNKIYKEHEIRDYAAKLNKMVLDFLTMKKFMGDKFAKDEVAMDVLTDRELEKQFMKIIMNYKQSIYTEGLDRDAFPREYKANSKYFDFMTLHYPVLKKYESEEKIKLIESCRNNLKSNMFTALIADNVICIINKLEFEGKDCKFSETDGALINFMYEEFGSHGITSMMVLYKLLFDSFILPEIKSYEKYKKHFFRIAASLSIKEQEYHYRNLFILCSILKRKTSTEKFKNEAFALKKFYLETGLYRQVNSENLHFSFILNMIKQCSFVKDLLWLEKYLEKNIHEIKKADIKNLLTFISIYRKIMEKNFSGAFASLNDINLNSISVKYEFRILKLKLLYETGEVMNTLDDINSMREFIKRDRFLTKDLKKKVMNFVFYLERLIKNSVNKKKLEDCKLELSYEKEIFFKEWLMKKYSEKAG